MFRKRKKNTSARIEVCEVLRGCEAGRLQSVGYMQVIPLVSDLNDDRFVSPVQCDADVYTTSYGTLGFRNTSESVMIVPCHAGYVEIGLISYRRRAPIPLAAPKQNRVLLAAGAKPRSFV